MKGLGDEVIGGEQSRGAQCGTKSARGRGARRRFRGCEIGDGSECAGRCGAGNEKGRYPQPGGTQGLAASVAGDEEEGRGDEVR